MIHCHLEVKEQMADLIQTLTSYLHKENEKALRRLEQRLQEEGYEPDFFGEVKPYVDEFYPKKDEWQELCKQWIKEEKPKYIAPNQIDSTEENLNNVVLQSFYKDTKVKRFKQMYQANKYVLESILTYKEKGNESI